MPEELSSKSKVKIRMPASVNQMAHRHLKSASSGPRSVRISDLNDIDCYAIVVSYDDGQGICTDSTPDIILSNAKAVFGSIPDGEEVEIIVDSGPSRTFHILGFSETSGICPNFHSLTQTQRAAMSNPFLVGSKTEDLISEFQDVEINISMTGSQEVTGSCTGIPFNWETTATGIWDSSLWDVATWGP